MEKTLTVEERLARIEEVLEKSGLGLLAQIGTGETLAENLGLLLDPKNLELVSLLARFLDQAEALGKLAETLEKLEKSGALAFLGHLSENFGEGLGMLMEPQLLRLISHGANVLDILSRIEPAAIGMMASALERGLAETFTPETLREPPRVGLAGILKQLADPEVQKALGVLFLLLKVLGKAFGHMNEDMKALEGLMAKMMKK
ncbi:helical membrane plugin domain-containing protein [Thermus brockianus]